MADSLGIQGAGLAQLRRDLRKLQERGIDSRLRDGLLSAAEIVAQDARSRSGYSSRIPASIRVGVSKTNARVYVKAGGAKAPHAVTFEGRSNGGPRKHPVYARGDRKTWHWAPQIPPKPFMRPALEARQGEVEIAVAGLMEQAFIDHGWHR